MMFSLIGSALRPGCEPRGYLEALFRGLPKLGNATGDEQLEPRLPDRWTSEPYAAT